MILKSCFVLGFFQIILINSEQQQKECRSFDSLISYPAARRNESVIDEYFGEKVTISLDSIIHIFCVSVCIFPCKIV